jgi:hypothetical protein
MMLGMRIVSGTASECLIQLSDHPTRPTRAAGRQSPVKIGTAMKLKLLLLPSVPVNSPGIERVSTMLQSRTRCAGCSPIRKM